MIRYTLFLLVVLGSAASAIAAIAPSHRTGAVMPAENVTLIEKNQAFPLIGPLVVEECLTDDCSLTQG